jgi:thiamine pyrophosphate-dependent acetolactate synthase large subunit-like protein
MDKVTGGCLLIRALKAHGIDRIYSIPGAPLFPVYEACLNEGVEVIVGRHEAAVVHTAEGWSRATGEPSVVLVAPGPGLSNAVPGIAIAHAECSPVIVLSGIDVVLRLGKGGRQELPQVEMCDSITKWSVLLSDVKRIPEYIARAFRIATTGMPGPVHISVTADTMSGQADPAEVVMSIPAKSRPSSAVGAEPAFIEQAIALLAGAERPVVIAGVAAFWSHAGPVLRELIETVKIPLFTVEQARGLVPDGHPYCFGDGYGTVNPAAQLLNRADAIMVLGERIDCAFSYGGCFGPAKIIHICPNPDDIGKNHPVECGAACDARVATTQLLSAARSRKWTEPAAWLETLRQTRRDRGTQVRKLAASEETTVHPARIALDVEDMLNDQDILVFDGGDFSSWARYCTSARRPGGWLASTVLGHLGVGLPYAMGAKLAFPESKVVVLTGDGAMGFSVMEFETAVRHRIPVVVVIANDAAYGVEVYYQAKWFGPDRVVGTELTNTRWDLMAESMGGLGEYVDTPDKLKPALQRAFASGKPACINIITKTTPSPQTQTFSRMYLLKRAKARSGT